MSPVQNRQRSLRFVWEIGRPVGAL